MLVVIFLGGGLLVMFLVLIYSDLVDVGDLFCVFS